MLEMMQAGTEITRARARDKGCARWQDGGILQARSSRALCQANCLTSELVMLSVMVYLE